MDGIATGMTMKASEANVRGRWCWRGRREMNFLLSSNTSIAFTSVFNISSHKPSSTSSSSSTFIRRHNTRPRKGVARQRVGTPPTCHLRGGAKRPVANDGPGCMCLRHASVAHAGKEVFYRVWPVPAVYGATRATVMIIPGLMWHSGWFWRIGAALSANGIKVIGIDPLSSGRSDDIDERRALVYDFERDHVQDLKMILQRVVTENEKVFIMGESSGCVTACLLAMNPPLGISISGWILLGAGLKISNRILPPKVIVFVMTRIIARMWPLLAAPNGTSGETFDLAFDDGGVSAAVGRNDEYTLYDVPIPLATVRATMDALAKVERGLEKGGVYMSNVLAVHNRKDVRTCYEGSEQLIERVVTKRGGIKRLIDPGGNAHQLLQERPEVCMQVIEYITAFVNEVLRMSD